MEEMDRNRTEQGRQVHMGNTYIQYIYIYKGAFQDSCPTQGGAIKLQRLPQNSNQKEKSSSTCGAHSQRAEASYSSAAFIDSGPTCSCCQTRMLDRTGMLFQNRCIQLRIARISLKQKKGERNVPSKCRTIQRQGCCGIWDVCMKFSAETGMHKAPVKERSVRWIQRAGGQTCIIDLSGLGMFLKASLDIYKKQYDQS